MKTNYGFTNSTRCAEKYIVELEQLASRHHDRNNNLVRIAILGILAGNRTDEEIVADLIRAGGRPVLTDAEVRRAVGTARTWLERGTGTAGKSVRRATPAERGWVQTMITRGAGVTAEDIRRASPHGTDGMAAFVHAVLAAERKPASGMRFDIVDKFWVGRDKNDGRLVSAFDLHNRDWSFNPIPNFIIPNPLTGQLASAKDGHPSLRCDAAVKSARLMVIEFDNLPLAAQLCFWGGVLETGALRVVTLTDSGNKSIHGLVEVEGDYAAFRDRILHLCCSADDERYRCDRAVLHPSALTRLAGAFRAETGREQRLLFADAR